MNGNNQTLTTYNVRVGHNVVTVKCQNEEEAVEAARKQLSLDLPRMWDVIQSLDATRFEVARAA